MKIDGNSLLRSVPDGADAKRSEGGFKAALSRVGRDTSSVSSTARINCQNPAFFLSNDAPHASPTRPENPVAMNAGAIDGAAGTNSWHRVRRGDTLSRIVQSGLKTLDQTATPQALAQLTRTIAQLNKISNSDRIYPGQKINLAFLGNPRSSIVEAAPVPSPRNATAPAPDATTYQALDFKTAAQVEVAPVSESALNTAPIFRLQDGAPEQSAGSRQMINAYLPDQLQDRPNTSSATERYFDDATDTKAAPPPPATSLAREKPAALPDILYKGVIGKALDALPINPATRTTLQQTNAIVSGSMAGRSLAAITGLASPVLAVAGLIWGIFSAKNIGAAAVDNKATTADGNLNTPATPGLPGDSLTAQRMAQEKLSSSTFANSPD